MAAIESDLSDIQFLGNWSTQQPSSISFVSAIVLTPVGAETSPTDIPQTFSRHQTSVVHVGRAITADPPVYSDDSATFSNPVMSRKHAKITFADSGSIFIIDTNSHHGTWVSRPTAEFKLAAESPFQLQDGDRLTFGKVVQRNGIHKPLTVAVKLLHSSSTPSSMSISSTSVSPASRAVSPKPRNRFGLDSSSDSDFSSDNEDPHDTDPCTGPNAIRVDLPVHRLDGRNLVSGSPKSPRVNLVHSEPGTPDNTKPLLNTSPLSSPLPFPSPPRSGFHGLQVDILSPPGLELEEMGIAADAALEGSPGSNARQSPLPPWRRLGGNPWSNVNTSLFDRIPDLLQQPPRRLGRLLNPLLVRTSRTTGVEETGEMVSSSRRLQNTGDVIDIIHESHEHPSHGLHHGHNHVHHGHVPLHGPHHHGYGAHGFRLDADWGYYGQSGIVKKEVEALSEQFEELKKDQETLKAKREEGNNLKMVFDRLDELSSQLKNKIAEDAKVSQQALFAESAGLNVLKDSIATLQTEVSLLKSHDNTSQSDIRSLLADHVILQTDYKENSEKHAKDTKTITDNVHNLRNDVQNLRCEFDDGCVDSSIQTLHVRKELTVLNEKLSGVHNIFKEIVQSEVKALMEKEGEHSPILGKRKRGDEECTGTSINGATSARRPKRLRVVADCAAAGAVGALGAWLGLAFL